MEGEAELRLEREYTGRVQQLLMAVIERSKDYSDGHISSIKMMLADAWEELRLKTTALSVQDMEQLATEVDRFLARKALTDDLAQRYGQMLLNPFFARVDFKEDGSDETEKIVIGLYSLKDTDGTLLVHDWRAPVCSLYYDDMPGAVSYKSPAGLISGFMPLKRQYKMEDGRLKYYVDTDIGIDDELLLDILSGTTSRHIRQIVATIQTEQNKAIRCANTRLLSVIGGAGSGKTSVAMHRAAFLMYRHREQLDAKRIMILSPSNSFSEYISTVLPELGEENTCSITMHKLISGILKDAKLEKPLINTEILLNEDNVLRRDSVRFKSDAEFLKRLNAFCERYEKEGPEFEDIALDNKVLATAQELRRMYRESFTRLSPALRLIRIKSIMDSRLEGWEKTLYSGYESQLMSKYRGKDLDVATRFAVSHRLQPVRRQLKTLLEADAKLMYAKVLEGTGEFETLALENARSGIVWWEDAPGICYIAVKCGFAQPDKSIRHLMVDEAQDYSETALSLLSIYYPAAHVTLLGDPKQRTCPAMKPCVPENWNLCFNAPDAPIMTLSRCYRSTLNITRLCNAILPDEDQVVPFGREGAMPEIIQNTDKNLISAVTRYANEGISSIAVITRTLSEAQRIADFIPKAHLLDGSEEDIITDPGDVAVGSYHLMKGLEYDAVIVAWSPARISDGERRRLYTACSRALHRLTLAADKKLIDELGIIL